MSWNNHRSAKKLLFVSSTCLAIVACSPEQFDDSLGSRALGEDVLGNGFGFATANNIGVMNGDLANEMAANLTRLFASQAPAVVNFAFNQSNLDAQSRAALNQQAAWMKANPNITFRVFGHTDKVGSEAYNQGLGKRRARAVVNYLIAQGVDRRKVEAVISFGETQPLVFTEARNRQNRRAVTEVKGFFSRDGRPADGRFAIGVYNRYVQQMRDLKGAKRPVFNASPQTTLSTGVATGGGGGGGQAGN